MTSGLENTVDTGQLNGGSWALMYFQESHAAAVAHQAGEGQFSAGETTANT